MKKSELKQIIKEEIEKVFNTSFVTVSGKTVDPSTIEIDGIDTRDYPDFADAYASYAEFTDGVALTDDELYELDDKYSDLIHELVFKKFF
jgi:hypothetical protein